jgi:asparagine synthase (glutamine-hydrolysing)
MSAFVCILDRSGADLDEQQVHRLAEPLAGYGGTLSSFCQGPVAIALRHSGHADDKRHGPLGDPEKGLVVAVAGRFSAVDGDASPAVADDRPAASVPASTALGALLNRDASFPAGVCGSFVIIAANPERCWLSLARDHLGDLKAYFHLDQRWFIAASEPTAILRHAAVGDDLDEHSAARFLGFRFSQTERSFFRQINELAPAHRLRVTADDCRAEQYWRFRLHRREERPPEEIRTGFLTRLRRSIADQMAGLATERVALSLSGGLDSTTLAALAPHGVQFFSWRLDRTSGPAERRNIEAVAEYLNTPTHWVDGDGLYPLHGEYVDRFVHGNSPHLNAFAALKHRLYQAARARGCRRIMVGDGGDALYSAKEYWLRDALIRGRAGALADLGETTRRAARGDRFARLALRRLLPLSGIRRALGRNPLPWLTDAARSLLPETRLSPILPEARRLRRYDLSVGAKHTELESEEQRLFAQCGIARSNPFWYWPLLEMVINLPAYWYYGDGRSKLLTRQAVQGLLPDSVVESGTVGLLGSFFLRGIESRHRELRDTVFRRPRSDWPRYVRRAWLEPHLDSTRSLRFGHTILWRVISYELWYRHLIRS